MPVDCCRVHMLKTLDQNSSTWFDLDKPYSMKMPNEFTSKERYSHCAVSLDNFLIIIGGGRHNNTYSPREIWICNLYTEEWKKHETPNTCAPEPAIGVAASAIEKTIYTFGGRSTIYPYNLSNALWKLSKTKEGYFTWSFNKPQCTEKSPSPRANHSAWEYAGKLWIFGGYGDSPESYLNDHGDFNKGLLEFAMNNQLLCFDPNESWTNPQCFGSIPTSRSGHACAVRSDKLWLFGGKDEDRNCLDDMFELRMSSLTWSQIQTAQFHPEGRTYCTLTPDGDDKLVLHGGLIEHQRRSPIVLSNTWIMDLRSHSWRQCTSRNDFARAGHTGSTGLHNRVIIIGGIKSFQLIKTQITIIY